jgi:hypothetical protein
VTTVTVVIRGAGTLDGENVQFGDGATSGANAGMVACGETARADHTSIYPHAYPAQGRYLFTDDVDAIGPPPACTRERAVATVVVEVGTSNP